MDRAPLFLALLAVGASLTIPGLAEGQDGQGTEPAYDWRGRLTFHDTVTIAAGETLRVAPGTVVSGTARIEVQGSLVVEGTADQPVELGLPVHLMGEDGSTFRHTRFRAVAETALNVTSGVATLENATFEGNTRAVRIAGDGRVTLVNATLQDHVGEAIYAEGSGSLTIAGSTFARNGRGLAVYSIAALDVSDSRFVANGQHLVVDLWPWSAAGEMTLEGNDFQAPARGAVPLPGIQLRHDGSLAEEQPPRLVTMRENRIADAAVGLRAEGRGLVVESTDDTFEGNDLAVSAQLAKVTLRRPTLANARDVDGTSITLEDPRYTGAGAPVATSGETRASWLPWALAGALGAVLVGIGALTYRAAKGRASPEPAQAPPPASRAAAPQPLAAPPAPAEGPARRVDLGAPVTALERRILEDIVAHPGTSQRAVADRLGYTRQALHYHVKRLEARGLLEKSIEGRETRCAVPPDVARALSTPAVTQTGSQEKG